MFTIIAQMASKEEARTFASIVQVLIHAQSPLPLFFPLFFFFFYSFPKKAACTYVFTIVLSPYDSFLLAVLTPKHISDQV